MVDNFSRSKSNWRHSTDQLPSSQLPASVQSAQFPSSNHYNFSHNASQPPFQTSQNSHQPNSLAFFQDAPRASSHNNWATQSSSENYMDGRRIPSFPPLSLPLSHPSTFSSLPSLYPSDLSSKSTENGYLQNETFPRSPTSFLPPLQQPQRSSQLFFTAKELPLPLSSAPPQNTFPSYSANSPSFPHQPEASSITNPSNTGSAISLSSGGSASNVSSEPENSDENWKNKHKRKIDDEPGASQQEQKKEIHNATEKRRREKINTKLDELKELIPHCKDTATNKAGVLCQAIDYIKYLAQTFQEQAETNKILQEKNTQLQDQVNKLTRGIVAKNQSTPTNSSPIAVAASGEQVEGQLQPYDGDYPLPHNIRPNQNTLPHTPPSHSFPHQHDKETMSNFFTNSHSLPNSQPQLQTQPLSQPFQMYSPPLSSSSSSPSSSSEVPLTSRNDQEDDKT